MFSTCPTNRPSQLILYVIPILLLVSCRSSSERSQSLLKGSAIESGGRQGTAETPRNSLIRDRARMEDDRSSLVSSAVVTDLPNFPGKHKAPKAGRYMGYVNIRSKKTSYPIVIDMISYRQNKDFYKFRSVVKVLSETYGSNEYSAAYFQHVDFRIRDRSLFFKSKNKKFQLENVILYEDVLKGEIKFANTAIEADFIVSWQTAMKSKTSFQDMLVEFPIAQNITGSYRGLCQEDMLDIQLEVHRRSGRGEEGLATPFDWKVVGRQGLVGSEKCSKSVCSNVSFFDGKYDFGRGRIELRSNDFVKECFLQGKSLNCDGCVFDPFKGGQRAFTLNRSYNVHLRQHKVSYANGVAKKIRPTPDAVTGSYYGYLHHESLDQYQLVRLNITHSIRKNSAGVPWDFLQGSASLFFGDSKFEEFIAYQFKPRRYVKERPVFMFDGDGESFFAVTRWVNGGLEGVWYSKNFGRVGSVQFVKGRVPSIPASASFVNSLGGKYSSSGGSFQLVAKADLSSTSDSFYPLKVYGWAIDFRQHNRKVLVTSGFYDFYTGMVSLTLDDKRMVLGSIHGKTAHIYLPPLVHQSMSLGYQRSAKFEIRDLIEPRMPTASSKLRDSVIGRAIMKSSTK